MNRLLSLTFVLLLPLVMGSQVTACRTATTPAGGEDATSATDGAVDIADDTTPLTACKTDCDKQKHDCATIDLQQCYGLCAYVLPGLKTGCVVPQTAVWQCEAVALFICATDTQVVGKLADANACHAEHAARDAACAK